MTEPRFTVAPSAVVSGRYIVRDERTGLLARDSRGRPATARTEAEAVKLAEKLGRNAVCLGCRHLRPVADMIERRCPECRESA